MLLFLRFILIHSNDCQSPSLLARVPLMRCEVNLSPPTSTRNIFRLVVQTFGCASVTPKITRRCRHRNAIQRTLPIADKRQAS
ncbi:hypothetical protein BDQ94DRAFT_119785 [Aspergillus welwitschiae]|uniref:Secreted protein n=1 Tax=Aspergillus welwitschiae TaxID=1341132 RepID=A0A3F3PJS7_9EURO|nr:hypothetical protein BDQ94DRAFT_119785 [Aspergillus welwitschiae]RDH27127.1 hypothetical protein BDQ94DRAFT_119785 [Aspergillus welwitschiae]